MPLANIPFYGAFVEQSRLNRQQGTEDLKQISTISSIQQQQALINLEKLKLQQAQLEIDRKERQNRIVEDFIRQRFPDLLKPATQGQPTGALPAQVAGMAQPGQGAPQPTQGLPGEGLVLLGGLAGMPAISKVGEMQFEASKGVAQRPGAPVVNPRTGEIIAPAPPVMPPGMTYNPQTMGAVPIAGTTEELARRAGLNAGAAAAGALPLHPPTSIQTPGAPTLMTPGQAIQYATGSPPPTVGEVINPQARAQTPGVIRLEAPDRQTAEAWTKSLADQNIPHSISIAGETKPGRPGVPLQSEQDQAEQRSFGNVLAGLQKTVFENSAKATEKLKIIDQLEKFGHEFQGGRLAGFQKGIGEWALALGADPDWVKQNVGNITSMGAVNSISIQLAGKITRESDAQPSQLQYFKILESIPSHLRPRDTFDKIIAGMRDIQKVTVAKAVALDRWKSEHGGSSDGFESAWPGQAAKLPFVQKYENMAKTLEQFANSRAKPVGGARFLGFE